MHASWLEIDLGRLDANVAAWRALLKREQPDRPAKVCAVVKADAYGLGAATVARHLANRVDMLAVFSPEQADEILALEPTCPILVFMPIHEPLHSHALRTAAARGQLHLTIHDPGGLVAANAVGQSLGVRFPVHLYVDTGMCRAGLTLEELPPVVKRLSTLNHVKLAGVYTHFASAEHDAASVERQNALLDEALDSIKPWLRDGVTVHAANTAGVCRGVRSHRDMIRIGIGLYGYGPESMAGVDPQRTPALRHVVRWCCRVAHVQRYPKGATVGYGSTHRLERESLLGVLPVGYADGYPLSLSSRGQVRLVSPTGYGHAVAPVVGRVNMDQIVVDLTDVHAPASGSLVGALVELVSADPSSPCSLPRLAERGQTNCYELLCRLSPRVRRTFVQAAVKGNLGLAGA